MQAIQFVTQNAIKLRHTQTHTSIELPRNLLVIHIGKVNGRIPLDVDLSDFPNSDMVSRLQAKIRREGNIYFIEDMRSAKGTYLNQKRLAIGQRYRLKAGDKISFGQGNLVSFFFGLF
ncbi:MAG TPA: FHA domain-containing protein [Candidatus Sericytochromatia bacterium]|jgi:pSer/pThr/pTyr-binding forkhead associated (FHA) protein